MYLLYVLYSLYTTKEIINLYIYTIVNDNDDANPLFARRKTNLIRVLFVFLLMSLF